MDCRPARTKNPDLWMESTPEISRPLCETLRDWILTWEPGLTESIKWNMLCYSGVRLVCALGGYKKCAGLTFFRGGELPEATALCDRVSANASVASMRIHSVDSLDRGALRRLLRAAVRLDETVPPPSPERTTPRPLPEVPPVLSKALRQNRAAGKFFATLKPTYQREYIFWVGMAKRPETQRRRLAETIAALAAGRKWAQRKL